MLANKNMLANTTASPARVAGTKRNIDALCDDFTLTVKIKKTITKTKLKKKRLDDLSLELSSMSMSSSSSSSSSPPPPKLLDLVGDDELRLIGSFLADPNDRRNLALTSHDAYRLFARA